MNYVEIIGHNYPECQVSCFGDPTDYTSLTWEGGTPLPTEAVLQQDLLAFQQDAVWINIKAIRDLREQENGTPVKVGEVQKWFHSDDPSKIKQVALKVAAENNMIPPDLMWKTMDGTFVHMTNQLALQIFVGAMLKSTEIFAVAEQHRLNMLALPDPTSYDYLGGWPQTFKEWQASQS